MSLSVTAQIPTAKEARKQAYDAKVKDSLLNIEIQRLRVESAIEDAVNDGKDSARVWSINKAIKKELENKGYTIKLINREFNYWRIYW